MIFRSTFTHLTITVFVVVAISGEIDTSRTTGG